MKAVCFKKHCVWRTQIETGKYFCPFWKCPYEGVINNDRKRAEQAVLDKEENKKVKTKN